MADLAATGRPIGINDSWIAATCWTRQYTLVPSNVREFSHVAGLQIEKW